MHPYRTHNCGELRPEHVGETVRLSGWVHRKRDHGQLLFIDLRDHFGITQIVFQPEHAFFAQAEGARLESVLTVTGRVVARSAETVNPELPTGAVELVADDLVLESPAEPLPLQVNAERDYPRRPGCATASSICAARRCTEHPAARQGDLRASAGAWRRRASSSSRPRS